MKPLLKSVINYGDNGAIDVNVTRLYTPWDLTITYLMSRLHFLTSQSFAVPLRHFHTAPRHPVVPSAHTSPCPHPTAGTPEQGARTHVRLPSVAMGLGGGEQSI